jgi:hypothetical protein
MRVFRPVCGRVVVGFAQQRGLSNMLRAPLNVPAVVSSSLGRKKGKGGSTSTSQESETDLRGEAVVQLNEKVAASLERLKRDLSQISAGKASPDLLAKVMVEAHGAREPIAKVAQVAVKDHQTLLVNVFDPDLVKVGSSACFELFLKP